MRYTTPHALENAVKEAAKNSQIETSRAISLFWWDRFLTRVFYDSKTDFVLKGGMSMLARMGTRYTKDIDLSAEEVDIESAQTRLINLVSRDLGDFFLFPLVSSRPIVEEAEYRSGRNLSFKVFVGGVERGTIKVDLVIGCTPIGSPEIVTPRQRLNIKGLKYSDYPLYPIVDTISDKVSATLSRYPDGRYSSRVRDLVDLTLIALTTHVEGSLLHSALESEVQRRSSVKHSEFVIPDTWRTSPLSQTYLKLAKQAGLPSRFEDVEIASKLVSSMLNPILADERKSGVWSPELLEWTD